MSLYTLFSKHPVICTDSRSCPKDSIFFALKGDNFNANAFALQALNNGCSYAVVDEKEYAVDERFILVGDVLKSLQELAKRHRTKSSATIIAITGTNGKTTTKELMAAVLKRQYNVLYTEGNLNNHIGVPLTLLKLKPEHDIAVVEMGASHVGEIALLASIASPDYGMITNVGKAHLEGFGSFEGVKKAKSELYQNIALSGNNKVFINVNNKDLVEMADTSGIQPDNRMLYAQSDFDGRLSASGTVTDCSPLLKMCCETNNGKFDVKTNLIGSYNAENVLAAIAVGSYFGVGNDEIKTALEEYQPTNNRSQLFVTERNRLIVDAYNANPSSMQEAVVNFLSISHPNKYWILGDMLELGEQSKEEHQKIIDLLFADGEKNVYFVGANFAKISKHYPSFEKVDDLIAFLSQNEITDSLVLIKGSRGVKLERVINFL